jgi:DNA repair protein RadC
MKRKVIAYPSNMFPVIELASKSDLLAEKTRSLNNALRAAAFFENRICNICAMKALHCALLDDKWHVKAVYKVYIEVGWQSTLNPQWIFEAAIFMNAKKLLIAHTCPVPPLIPAKPDKEFTDIIMTGTDALNIQLLDHIILLKDGFYSFSQEKLIPNHYECA